MNLKTSEFLFLDAQTIGMRPPRGRLLELAWCKARAGDDELKVDSHLIALPEGLTLPRMVTDLTGITDADMKNALPLEDVHKAFAAEALSLPGPPIALIHYAQFEKPFLADMYGGAELPFEILCTQALVKRLFPGLPSHNIRGAGGFFGNPVEGIKRAGHHVIATHQIWRGIVEALEKEGVADLEALRAWIGERPKAPRANYAYRMDRMKRLRLPDEPGIYRMLAKTGQVLYVGKATSLKSRVNSYFRGQKSRDKRKLEMLAQVWDLEVVNCGTPLEAALLETDEIKRLNPPYNVVMKLGRRHLVFYDRAMNSASVTQSRDYPIGPFKNSNWIEHLRALDRSLSRGEFEPVFWVPIPDDQMRRAFAMFVQKFALENVTWNVRHMLAFGMKLVRDGYAEEEKDEDVEREINEQGERVYTDQEVETAVQRGLGVLATPQDDPHAERARLPHPQRPNARLGFPQRQDGVRGRRRRWRMALGKFGRRDVRPHERSDFRAAEIRA